MKVLILNCVKSITLCIITHKSITSEKKNSDHKTCQIKWSGKLNACLDQMFSEDHTSSNFLALPFKCFRLK